MIIQMHEEALLLLYKKMKIPEEMVISNLISAKQFFLIRLEILFVFHQMGHNIGVSASYYKPKEKEVLEDYLKAVDLLTISNDKVILAKQVAELTQKGKDNEYVIRGKLQEKDEEMKTMKEQFNTLFK